MTVTPRELLAEWRARISPDLRDVYHDTLRDAYEVAADELQAALAAMEGEAVGEVYALPTGEHRVQLFKEHRDLPVGTKLYSAPPSSIDPAAVLALADRLEGIVDACAANGADRIEGMDTAISELRSLATGGKNMHGWRIEIKPDRDGEVGVWAVNGDVSIWVSALATGGQDGR